MPHLEVVNVVKRFGSVTAVDDVSLTVDGDEFLVLLGPSGCGKSTLLRMIAGLEDVTSGDIFLDGRWMNYVLPAQRDVAMVFQNYALYPHMTVRQNLAFPLRRAGVPKQEVRGRVDDTARLLSLERELDRRPGELSGGQRQRTALGRAIIRRPKLFLMDEPLSNLDALLRVQMREELLQLHRRVGQAVVYVTHDQVEAMTMGDRVAVMRDGVVQQIGKPQDVYDEPTNVFVATFMGSPGMNLLEGEVSSDGQRCEFQAPGVAVNLPAELASAWRKRSNGMRSATVGVRSEHLELDVGGGAAAAIPGTIVLLEPAGPEMFVRLELETGHTWVARTGRRADLAEGARVKIAVDAAHLHIFDHLGERVGE